MVFFLGTSRDRLYSIYSFYSIYSIYSIYSFYSLYFLMMAMVVESQSKTEFRPCCS